MNKYLSCLFLAIRLFVYQYLIFKWFIYSTPVIDVGIDQYLNFIRPLWYLLCLILPIIILLFPSFHKHRKIWEILFIIALYAFLDNAWTQHGMMAPLDKWIVMFRSWLNNTRPDYSHVNY